PKITYYMGNTGSFSHFCINQLQYRMKSAIYNGLAQKKTQGKKSFAVLIDPDKVNKVVLNELIELSISARVDYLLVGGSLVISNHLDDCVQHIKQNCDIPVILFPGSPSQVSKYADALLYLSLISGRNPELLIGQHVVSAPFVKQSGLEIMPTGYIVIDGGAPTTVSYISNAAPVPADKNEIAMCTAMAGEMLGMKLIYMDAGSGAKRPITESMIKAVADHIEAPLIIGGGIIQPEKAYLNCKAGADVIVVGNAIEKNASLIKEMAAAIHSVPVKV
ncbi:MAG TPA: geranylgeranylglyceryl/heptaprenylglyceryl phosphate synthase, partial [Chitinophagaceae bacterium]|nr:geranylgeranylglyceryl/heptaprenylglyceryl phosphate synthase [Chitinophagaceae bacterium]